MRAFTILAHLHAQSETGDKTMTPKCYCDQLYAEYREGPCDVCEAELDAQADKAYFDGLEQYERAREDEADLRDIETPGNFEDWMI